MPARALLLAGVLLVVAASALPPPSDLRVEYLHEPLSIGVAQPRFSFVVDCGSGDWASSGCPRGLGVEAYRITVANAATGAVVWTTGVHPTIDGRTSQIVYGVDTHNDGDDAAAAATPLEANTDYTWSAEWFPDAHGNATGGGAANSTFSTSLFLEADWQGAEWIGSDAQRHLKRVVPVHGGRAVVRARAFVAAPGCHTLRVNGVVSDDTLGVCPWTQFTHTVTFRTHDIGGLLAPGDNEIELLLGNGMWVHFGATDPAVRAIIIVELDDGSTVVARTAASKAPAPTPASSLKCARIPEHSNVTVGCADVPGTVVSAVTFASFGTPSGQCGAGGGSNNTFAVNESCHSPFSGPAVQEECLGLPSCMLAPHCTDHACRVGSGSRVDFDDPCPEVRKDLAVAISCAAPAPGPTPPGPVPTAADRNWTASRGPFVRDDPFLGTATDMAIANDASLQSWAPATAAPQVPSGQLQSLMMPLARRLRTMPALAATATPSGGVRFDFSENFVGVTELVDPVLLAAAFGVNAPHDGGGDGGGGGGDAAVCNFTVQHCEKYNHSSGEVICDLTGAAGGPNGTRDTYYNTPLTGGQPLLPRFTWHGFQYAEVWVDGAAATPASVAAVGAKLLGALAGVEVRTDIEQTGTVQFSGVGGADHILNSIQRILTNSQKANVAAYQPTDCPTREKHGWLGDAQVTAEEAMLNFNMAPVYTAFLRTIRDNQQPATSQRAGDVPGVVPTNSVQGAVGAGAASAAAAAVGVTDISWSAAFPLITRWMLRHYGDQQIVDEFYPSLARYMDGLLAAAKAEPAALGLPDFFTWGDWCAVENRSLATPGTGPELAAFNFLLGADAMADMAPTADDKAKWAGVGAALRKVFHQRFFNASTQAYGSAELELQTLTVAPLALEERAAVIPDADRPAVLASLKRDVMQTQGGHLTVGSVGAKHLLPQLTRNGMHDVAMAVATQTTFPSYGYWLSQGATTCWEDYSGVADGTHPPPPTRNHIFLCGGVGEWMYRSVAGIGPASDGYATVFVRPHIATGPNAPVSASAMLRSPRGPTTVRWSTANGTASPAFALSLQATIPVGVQGANVTVPCVVSSGADVASCTPAVTIHESGHPVWANDAFVPGQAGVLAGAMSADGAGVTFETTSGSFNFTLVGA